MTLCNNEGTAWTGVQLGSNLAQTFFTGLAGKQSKLFISILLSGTTWKDGTNTIEFGPSLENMLYSNNRDKNSSYQYVKRLIKPKENEPGLFIDL